MCKEVAVFIDLENLRYGLLNQYGQEPDFQSIVDKATKYGRPSLMRAYADFREHPSDITRKLQVAGIDAINVPVKRRTYLSVEGKPIERIKNAADMVLALDAVAEARAADTSGKQKVFLIVTGDRDYIKLVTMLRHQFGQPVVIVGVPGTVAKDLVDAAGDSDHYDISPPKPVDPMVLKRAIVAMVKKGPQPLKYWTLKVIDQWAQDPRQQIPGTAKERRDAITQLVKEGVLTKHEENIPERGLKAVATLNEARATELGYV